MNIIQIFVLFALFFSTFGHLVSIINTFVRKNSPDAVTVYKVLDTIDNRTISYYVVGGVLVAIVGYDLGEKLPPIIYDSYKITTRFNVGRTATDIEQTLKDDCANTSEQWGYEYVGVVILS